MNKRWKNARNTTHHHHHHTRTAARHWSPLATTIMQTMPPIAPPRWWPTWCTATHWHPPRHDHERVRNKRMARKKSSGQTHTLSCFLPPCHARRRVPHHHPPARDSTAHTSSHQQQHHAPCWTPRRGQRDAAMAIKRWTVDRRKKKVEKKRERCNL